MTTTPPVAPPGIVVDLSRRMVRVYTDYDDVLQEAPCAIGMKGFRTPVGRWELGSRSLRPDWRAPIWAAAFGMVPGKTYKFGEPGNPYSGGLINLVGVGYRTRARTGYAIHGSTNQESIRQRLAASHGCIRVPDDFIRWIYERCPTGTPVRTVR